MRQVALVMLALVANLVTPALAAERKALKDVDMGAFSQDSQLQLGGDGQFTLFWWIPVEFWEASLSKQAAAPADSEFVEALRPYILVGVVRASISNLGAFRFVDREAIRNGLQVRYERPGSSTLRLVAIEDVDPDVTIVLGQLRPILEGALGNMGQNMHFYTLTDSVEDGATPISPYEPGLMAVELGTTGEAGSVTGRLELPMNALFVPRQCPGGKPAHVSWKVCPWDGTPLKP